MFNLLPQFVIQKPKTFAVEFNMMYDNLQI